MERNSNVVLGSCPTRFTENDSKALKKIRSKLVEKPDLLRKVNKVMNYQASLAPLASHGS